MINIFELDGDLSKILEILKKHHCGSMHDENWVSIHEIIYHCDKLHEKITNDLISNGYKFPEKEVNNSG